MLLPKTVNGKPYSALELDELCATRKGSGDMLVYDAQAAWKRLPWASASQAASEWVLLPKSDPDPRKVSEEKHFREKTITLQQQVHDAHYQEYLEAEALKVMTAALLNDLVNGEPRMLDGNNYLRCVEPNAHMGRICVGYFASGTGLGVFVYDDIGDRSNRCIGRALTRKL